MSDRSHAQKGAVLIIEDERSVADALKIILQDEGYHVSTVLTGHDGIEEALRGEFCLAITDIGLPDMSGFDVIKAVCPHKQMHFIVITSQNLMIEAQDCGAAGFLLKPFQPSEIVELIRTTLARS